MITRSTNLLLRALETHPPNPKSTPQIQDSQHRSLSSCKTIHNWCPNHSEQSNRTTIKHQSIHYAKMWCCGHGGNLAQPPTSTNAAASAPAANVALGVRLTIYAHVHTKPPAATRFGPGWLSCRIDYHISIFIFPENRYRCAAIIVFFTIDLVVYRCALKPVTYRPIPEHPPTRYHPYPITQIQ